MHVERGPHSRQWLLQDLRSPALLRLLHLVPHECYGITEQGLKWTGLEGVGFSRKWLLHLSSKNSARKRRARRVLNNEHEPNCATSRSASQGAPAEPRRALQLCVVRLQDAKPRMVPIWYHAIDGQESKFLRAPLMPLPYKKVFARQLLPWRVQRTHSRPNRLRNDRERKVGNPTDRGQHRLRFEAQPARNRQLRTAQTRGRRVIGVTHVLATRASVGVEGGGRAGRAESHGTNLVPCPM